MNTDHGTSRASIGIFTDSDTSGIILTHSSAKGKGLFQRAIHIDYAGIFTNGNAVPLVHITADIGIAADGHIACIVFIANAAITFNVNVFPNSNAFITILYRIAIADHNGVFHNTVCVISNSVVVIPQYDGIGHIHKIILGTDHIRILGIGHLVLEPIHKIVLADGIFRSLQGIADTHDLGCLGIVHGVAAAHDHDLATAFWDRFLQDFRDFLHILILVCLHQFLQSFFIQLHFPVGIGNFVTSSHNDRRIGVLRIVHLAHHAAGGSVIGAIGIGINNI